VWKTTSQQLLDNLGLDFQPRFNYNIIRRWGEGLKENEMNYTLHINYTDSNDEVFTDTHQVGDLLAAMDHYGVPNRCCGKCVDFENTDESTRMLEEEFGLSIHAGLGWYAVAVANEEG
jgi:hypothetical protein|tara:strand:+ start:714 stop:1067 length:354 start_codon:yes stop_codon:yes gene_type:complete